jgi:hypothetical protein
MLTKLLTYLVPEPDVMNPGLDQSEPRARAWVHEAVCGIGGHDYVRHAVGNRMFLECTACGRQTPGWLIEGRPRSVFPSRPDRSKPY